jgi:hypothetical protein
VNATPIDISPLYWDRLSLPKELHLILPEARLLAFVRDPVPRFTSCYKYFCAEERGSTCSNEELENRVYDVVAKFRECVCGGQLGGSSPSPLAKCQTYQPLRRHKSRVDVVESEYQDAWPLTDLDVVATHYERCSVLRQWDALYHCGLVQGLYWIRLLQHWSIWGNRLRVIASDRWLNDTLGVFEEIETFFGLPLAEVEPPDHDLNIADAETHPDRPSKHTTLRLNAINIQCQGRGIPLQGLPAEQRAPGSYIAALECGSPLCELSKEAHCGGRVHHNKILGKRDLPGCPRD